MSISLTTIKKMLGLPSDIKNIIFSYIDNKTIFKILRVSKKINKNTLEYLKTFKKINVSEEYFQIPIVASNINIIKCKNFNYYFPNLSEITLCNSRITDNNITKFLNIQTANFQKCFFSIDNFFSNWKLLQNLTINECIIMSTQCLKKIINLKFLKLIKTSIPLNILLNINSSEIVIEKCVILYSSKQSFLLKVLNERKDIKQINCIVHLQL